MDQLTESLDNVDPEFAYVSIKLAEARLWIDAYDASLKKIEEDLKKMETDPATGEKRVMNEQ